MQNRGDRAGDADRIKRKSLSISFLVHFAGIFVLFVSPWDRHPKNTYEILPIQIIDIPEMEIPREPPPPEEKPETAPSAREKVAPPTKSRAKTVQPAVRPAPKVSGFSAEKFREALSARIEKPAQEKTVVKNAETVPVKVEKLESSVTEVNLPSLNLTIPEWYILLVQKRIRQNWKTYNMMGSRTTTVSFRIYRNGKIDGVALEKSSGNTGFDRSVVDAVRTAENLPYFPKEIPDAYLDIVIDFKTEG